MHMAKRLDQRGSTIATLCTRLAEYGLVAPVGRNGLQRLIAILGDPDDERVPVVAPRLAGAAGLPAQASE